MNANVISYPPTKDRKTEQGSLAQPTTPGKAEACSTVGTPARTPRRDLNNELLRGAVVFVDVHTSEGSDASAVFVDLLNQMGARCVKTWNWNPSHDGNGESKIGITHVVYKDGGKRDMMLAIGGADGLDPDLRARADVVLNLGSMTWPHQLVRILIAEQLYRAVTILSGHPYHRV